MCMVCVNIGTVNRILDFFVLIGLHFQLFFIIFFVMVLCAICHLFGYCFIFVVFILFCSGPSVL